jgi:hypothetical protein
MSSDLTNSVPKLVGNITKTAELLKKLGNLREELRDLLYKRYNLCNKEEKISDYSVIRVYLKESRWLKSVSIDMADIATSPAKFKNILITPRKILLEDDNYKTVREYDLCDITVYDLIEIAENIGDAVEESLKELEPLITKTSSFLDTVKRVVTALDMILRSI